MRMIEKSLLLSVYEIFPRFFRGTLRWALARWSFRPQHAHASLRRSHHYALGREHALRAKILRDRHAPW